MARIRTIKPELWTDEKLNECSVSARLLFVGLISFADDAGRQDFSPQRIKMQVFPCGTVSLDEVKSWLEQLIKRELVQRYTVDGREYLALPGFAKHQRINRPTPSKIPEPSLTTHGSFSEPSVTPTATRARAIRDPERNGTEGNGVDPETRADDHAMQQALQAAYPPRAGRVNWINALHAVVHLVDDHRATYPDLLEGTKRYARFCEASGKLRTEWVLTPEKFYGAPDRPWSQSWDLPAPEKGETARPPPTPEELERAEETHQRQLAESRERGKAELAQRVAALAASKKISPHP